MPVDLPDDTLVVYSDYVCPFCYLGKHSLERYLDETDEAPDVEWRPFDLRWHKRTADGEIDASVEDGKDEAYYERAKRNVERLKEEYGVEMALDLSREIDSWNAQKAALFVRREHGEEIFQAFHDAVFEALWVDARDIGDPDVLAEVAADVGLDPERVRQAVASEELEDDLRDALEASHRAGVTGVPTFVYNDLRLPGAIPPENIAKIVENG